MDPLERSPFVRFAIDVGGTFTDTVGVRADGSFVIDKRLSSGLWRSTVETIADGALTDPRLAGAPPGAWAGAIARFYRPDGSRLGAPLAVAACDGAAGRLTFHGEVPAELRPGLAYALHSGEEAPVAALRALLGVAPGELFPAVSVRLGTTRGTNALLTRALARTALLVTRGFGDLPVIRHQDRPELFALEIRRPSPLCQQVLEVEERLNADGEVLVPLNEELLARRLRDLRTEGIQSLAICFLHGYRHPAHEERAARLARDLGFRHVVRGSQTDPRPKYLRRLETTLVEAALGPVVRDFLDQVRHGLGPKVHLFLMQSGGGLAGPAHFHAVESVFSGPAGGVRALARVAAAEGLPRVLGLDMGGTSTDVSRWDGALRLVYEREVAGVHLSAPMVDLHTVAAGGGSVCRFDGTQLTVGPDSAGADPGPACYGLGGPLTLTDVNVALGLVPEDGNAPFPLDRRAVERRLDETAAALHAAGLPRPAPAALALGFRRVAHETMAEALRVVSVAEGYDPAAHALVAFGGAGPQHAAALARLLGIRTVVIPAHAAVLSALGIDATPLAVHQREPLEMPLSSLAPAELEARFAALATRTLQLLAQQGVPGDRVTLERRLECRCRGQDAALTLAVGAAVDAAALGALAAAFAEEHEQRYGHRPQAPVEVLSLLVAGAEAVPAPPHLGAAANGPDGPRGAPPDDRGPPTPAGRLTWRIDGDESEAPWYRRAELCPGHRCAGPALIVGDFAPVVVPRDWRIVVSASGALHLYDETPAARQALGTGDARCAARGAEVGGAGREAQECHFERSEAEREISIPPSARFLPPVEMTNVRSSPTPDTRHPTPDTRHPTPHARPPPSAIVPPSDPVQLEIFAQRFTGIARRMGRLLEQSAFSPNIKERRDFSCALFDTDGELVVNAPHIPVHLGAMAETVKACIARAEGCRPGDGWVTNDPAAGGSHLPDVTVIAPVFLTGAARPLFAACRAHHADVGGVEPGSMPARSTLLEHEGVVIPPFRWVRAGEADDAALRALLAAGPFPCRRPDENLADLRAQWAAVRLGVRELQALADEWGADVLTAYTAHLQEAACTKLQTALARLGAGRYEAADSLDDGALIKARIHVEAGRVTVDFSGTSPADPESNLNAPRAVTVAAVLYVLRCLVGRALPLNGGVRRVTTIRIPPGSLLDPPPQAAVAGGNVETSQRVVDVLLAALRLQAGSQGTMNNVTFGRDGNPSAGSEPAPDSIRGQALGFAYYETIGGGGGAGPEYAGASGVHTHMTNTRATDPEVLEARYPVLLRRFALRRGSGGAGRFPGGDGLIREYEFTECVQVSLLTERRERAPQGREGGEDGARGRNLVFRARSGELEPLPSRARLTLRARDRLIIETPGGGGWGTPPPETPPS